MGDLHGHYHTFITRLEKNKIKIEFNDKIIICGDFTFIYDGTNERIEGLKKLAEEKCEILFVCGNHENFVELSKFPEINKYGGRVKSIANNVSYMLRGNIYYIDGFSFFAFGGGYSNPQHQSLLWQEQEIPNHSEIQFAYNTLNKANRSVDYIITHSAPNDILNLLNITPFFSNTEFTDFLSFIYNNVRFKKWFCGHYHIDSSINNNTFSIVYDKIHRIF